MKGDAFVFESIEDGSSGIYVDDGDRWRLIAIEDPGEDMHPWPKNANPEEIVRWKTNCTYRRVELMRGVLAKNGGKNGGKGKRVPNKPKKKEPQNYAEYYSDDKNIIRPPMAKQGQWIEATCHLCGSGMELCDAERLLVCNCCDGRKRLHPKDYVQNFGALPGS
jgi:hypothetical protein